MKEFDLIYEAIKKRFTFHTGKSFADDSAMDFYAVAIADVLEEVYSDIESMKNPHLYSKLKDGSLDDLGFFMNIPREVGESDYQYLYRLMNWRYTAEASNLTAINNALLNTVHSSDAEYIPQTNGSGTASVYIIPKDYSIEKTSAAIEEATLLVGPVVSPAVHVEYVIPAPQPVLLHVGMKVALTADVETVKRSLTEKIRQYTNSVPPNAFLKVGAINRIGVNEEEVEYFNILQIFISGKEKDTLDIFQGLDYKFLLDEIVWSIEK